ncbi:uncharacterized protein [Syngnathus scovelli]|uniref:uncharacterized protein isoform X2 n=1 Tax=Syngnathus scovelli TaxID=161590 RepID=UPI0035CA93F6
MTGFHGIPVVKNCKKILARENRRKEANAYKQWNLLNTDGVAKKPKIDLLPEAKKMSWSEEDPVLTTDYRLQSPKSNIHKTEAPAVKVKDSPPKHLLCCPVMRERRMTASATGSMTTLWRIATSVPAISIVITLQLNSRRQQPTTQVLHRLSPLELKKNTSCLQDTNMGDCCQMHQTFQKCLQLLQCGCRPNWQVPLLDSFMSFQFGVFGAIVQYFLHLMMTAFIVLYGRLNT